MATAYVSVGVIPVPEDILRCATEYDLQVASVRLVREECEIPETVKPGEPFTLKYVYQFVQREYRSSGAHKDGCRETGGPPVETEWPNYWGGWRRCSRGAWPMCTEHVFWIWMMLYLRAYHNGGRIGDHIAQDLVDGQKFIYTWTGTIEELTGREFTEPTTVYDQFSIGGVIYGWFGQEWWPWGWPLEEEFAGEAEAYKLESPIYVDVYVPPPPIQIDIDEDFCWVDKEEAYPDESFNIRVRIKNLNDWDGSYWIGCLCEGKEQMLDSGEIAAGATLDLTFTVTANKLAQRDITESMLLSFTITANNAEVRTDSWTPRAIYVIVIPDTASLIGTVRDITTNDLLEAVTVTVGTSSTQTDATGYYSLTDLAPGTYDIVFTKADYYDETKRKTLVEGSNILNVAMTPETEPPPDGEIPWAMLALAGSLVIGAVIVISARRRNDPTKQ